MTGTDLPTLKASVRLLRDDMQAARLAYFRELLALRTLQGDAKACDRITRQIRNLILSQKPKASSSTRKDAK